VRRTWRERRASAVPAVPAEPEQPQPAHVLVRGADMQERIRLCEQHPHPVPDGTHILVPYRRNGKKQTMLCARCRALLQSHYPDIPVPT
jgi:hypothetical protein